jgi:serine/threonine protein kinase
MPWRLRVVDGADVDRYFPLADNGSLVIGNSHRHADACLHDLLVARVHCQVEAAEGRVFVKALTTDKDTLVNGQKVQESELRPGEILRVGNSHLRLEWDDGETATDDDEGFEEVVEDERIPAAAPTKHEGPPPRLSWEDLPKLSGYTLGHFEIGQVLGRGHTAVTFRARDVQARREVALKVIGPAFPANAAELQQFAKTIAKVAPIQEEHLVRQYAAGRTSGYVWISQEFVEGESLAHLLERGQSASMMLKWRNALKLAIDLAHALKAIHQRHLVHGHMSPTNVIISLDRTAKLNDLLYDEALSGSVWRNSKAEEVLLAELPYLAPERLEEGAYWDSAADIYSLGALVYARLTSQPPFQAKSVAAMIEAIRAGQIIKPRDVVRGCPEPFQNIILRMLAVSLEDRYQRAEQLIEDLEGIQAIV